MWLLHVILLAIVQGLAELLPISSSAHVIVADKLLGMDPTAPDTTLLLVMLHTGTGLAVILTPPAIFREVLRLHQTQQPGIVAVNLMPSLVGAVFAFLAGLLALKWLSRWLEAGRWYLFGIYCVVASMVVAYLYHAGY